MMEMRSTMPGIPFSFAEILISDETERYPKLPAEDMQNQAVSKSTSQQRILWMK